MSCGGWGPEKEVDKYTQWPHGAYSLMEAVDKSRVRETGVKRQKEHEVRKIT